MHIHILGICGTFMGGIAAIAKAAGHRVTGCDANVYPPMSTQLEAQGIGLIEGFTADQIGLAPDVYVIGNVVTRGNALMEQILDRGLPYVSGPQWLAENVLRGRWVLAVAGTHGKTTTTSMLAWILEHAGLAPGFLIGGVPENFGISARLPGAPAFPARGHVTGEAGSLREARPGARSRTESLRDDRVASAFPHKGGRRDPMASNDGGVRNDGGGKKNSLPLDGGGPGWGCADRSPFFVIEADEYDTAFFDKRSKFVHYAPRTVVLNNLEFDHADIFADLAAIETQFHHLVRTVPASGLIVANGGEASLGRVLARGCWTPVERFACDDGWQCGAQSADGRFAVSLGGKPQGEVRWDLLGTHNQHNALAAIAAARHAGVPVAAALAALAEFRNVKRRMEVRGSAAGITVYDDFAHHPTAIRTTLAGLRGKVGGARILAVLEPRSNTMKLGVMKDALPGSLADADRVYCYAANLGWDPAASLQPLGARAATLHDLPALVEAVAREARSGDHVLVMSNGGFGGIHEKLIRRLKELHGG
jgi:UDP-N-acetylmuramate: L-alanyl-gamma-D-glutamyl-meso-diaminopimelate ligase